MCLTRYGHREGFIRVITSQASLSCNAFTRIPVANAMATKLKMSDTQRLLISPGRQVVFFIARKTFQQQPYSEQKLLLFKVGWAGVLDTIL